LIHEDEIISLNPKSTKTILIYLLLFPPNGVIKAKPKLRTGETHQRTPLKVPKESHLKETKSGHENMQGRVIAKGCPKLGGRPVAMLTACHQQVLPKQQPDDHCALPTSIDHCALPTSIAECLISSVLVLFYSFSRYFLD